MFSKHCLPLTYCAHKIAHDYKKKLKNKKLFCDLVRPWTIWLPELQAEALIILKNNSQLWIEYIVWLGLGKYIALPNIYCLVGSLSEDYHIMNKVQWLQYFLFHGLTAKSNNLFSKKNFSQQFQYYFHWACIWWRKSDN